MTYVLSEYTPGHQERFILKYVEKLSSLTPVAYDLIRLWPIKGEMDLSPY